MYFLSLLAVHELHGRRLRLFADLGKECAVWRNKELTPKGEDVKLDNTVEACSGYDRVVYFYIFPEVFG